MKKAIVIGATGLVGTSLIQQLCNDADYESVLVLHRRKPAFSHPKVRVEIIDFENESTWAKFVVGDVIFSCLGTTLKVAGSKEAQYLIDFTYQYNIAKKGAENGVSQYILVSSVGADPKSGMFYLKMKGELEEAVSKLNYASIAFVRPNLLLGDRQEKRIGELIGYKVIKALNAIGLLKSQKPIPVDDVASKMIELAKTSTKDINIAEGTDLKTQLIIKKQ